MHLLQVRQYGETYLPDQYVIHDPSRAVVAGDFGLMVAVTGKEQGGGEQTLMFPPCPDAMTVSDKILSVPCIPVEPGGRLHVRGGDVIPAEGRGRLAARAVPADLQAGLGGRPGGRQRRGLLGAGPARRQDHALRGALALRRRGGRQLPGVAQVGVQIFFSSSDEELSKIGSAISSKR